MGNTRDITYWELVSRFLSKEPKQRGSGSSEELIPAWVVGDETRAVLYVETAEDWIQGGKPLLNLNKVADNQAASDRNQQDGCFLVDKLNFMTHARCVRSVVICAKGPVYEPVQRPVVRERVFPRL